MSDASSNSAEPGAEPVEPAEFQDRRHFLQGLGKWSGAAISAAVVGSWLASAPNAQGGAWINRRGVVAPRGGSWVNRPGGGSWVNRPGGWINGSGGWINRRVGGGSWINRR